MPFDRALPSCRRVAGSLVSLLLIVTLAACSRAQGATTFAPPAATNTALNVSVVATPGASQAEPSPAVLTVASSGQGTAASSSAAADSGEADSTTLAAPAQSNAAPASTTADAPVHIVIPRAGVNAPVAPLGETDGGAMATPATPTDVGWWQYGVAPGERGSAVFGGHLDFHDYGAAVFWNLNKLRPGDEVDVTSASGATLGFVVQASAVYQENDASVIDRIFRQQDAARLNLITCAGTFNPVTRDYDKRLVVYTVLAQ